MWKLNEIQISVSTHKVLLEHGTALGVSVLQGSFRSMVAIVSRWRQRPCGPQSPDGLLSDPSLNKFADSWARVLSPAEIIQGHFQR